MPHIIVLTKYVLSDTPAILYKIWAFSLLICVVRGHVCLCIQRGRNKLNRLTFIERFFTYTDPFNLDHNLGGGITNRSKFTVYLYQLIHMYIHIYNVSGENQRNVQCMYVQQDSSNSNNMCVSNSIMKDVGRGFGCLLLLYSISCLTAYDTTCFLVLPSLHDKV